MVPYLILAIAAIAGLMIAAKRLSNANPASLARGVKTAVGIGAILLAGVLSLRGLLPLGVPLFLFGLGMLGIGNPGGFNFSFGKRSSGTSSKVRTRLIAMALDHDSGKMDGEVLEGKFAGRFLSGMSLEELLRFRDDCKRAGDQSQALLEAYLDRTHAGWRGDEDAAESGAGQQGAPSPGTMDREEAAKILGVSPDASAEEIHAAHRRMMKKFHPDAGGSNYLATKINQAKQVLLGEA